MLVTINPRFGKTPSAIVPTVHIPMAQAYTSHQHQPESTDRDLVDQSFRKQFKNEVADKRQKDTHAEHFERPLAANDQRPPQA